MIYIDNIEKFNSIINKLKSDSVCVELFGQKFETFSGMHAGFDTPPNNTLRIKIAALTSVGTIYCNQSVKLSDSIAVASTTKIFSQLDVFPCELTYSSENGNISFK